MGEHRCEECRWWTPLAYGEGGCHGRCHAVPQQPMVGRDWCCWEWEEGHSRGDTHPLACAGDEVVVVNGNRFVFSVPGAPGVVLSVDVRDGIARVRREEEWVLPMWNIPMPREEGA